MPTSTLSTIDTADLQTPDKDSSTGPQIEELEGQGEGQGQTTKIEVRDLEAGQEPTLRIPFGIKRIVHEGEGEVTNGGLFKKRKSKGKLNLLKGHIISRN